MDQYVPCTCHTEARIGLDGIESTVDHGREYAAQVLAACDRAPMADQLIPVTINFLDGTSETLTGERLSDHFAIAPHILPKDRRFTGAWRLVHLPTGHWMAAPDFDEATVAQLRKVAEILTASTLDWGNVPHRDDKEGQRPFSAEFLTVVKHLLNERVERVGVYEAMGVDPEAGYPAAAVTEAFEAGVRAMADEVRPLLDTALADAAKWSQAAQAAGDHCRGVEAEVERLKREGSPGVMHEIDRAFHTLVVKERNRAEQVRDALNAKASSLLDERDSAWADLRTYRRLLWGMARKLTDQRRRTRDAMAVEADLWNRLVAAGVAHTHEFGPDGHCVAPACAAAPVSSVEPEQPTAEEFAAFNAATKCDFPISGTDELGIVVCGEALPCPEHSKPAVPVQAEARQPQPGDRVRVTGGAREGDEGVLTDHTDSYPDEPAPRLVIRVDSVRTLHLAVQPHHVEVIEQAPAGQDGGDQ